MIVEDATANKIAGHPAGTANLDIISWRDDEILIAGSDDESLSSWHAISVQVFGRSNGQESAVFTLEAAVPRTVSLDYDAPTRVEAFNTPLDISGHVLDQFNDPFLTNRVHWILSNVSTRDVQASDYASTDLAGQFHVPVPRLHSGTYLLQVSVEGGTGATPPYTSLVLSIFPRVLWFEPDHYATGTPELEVTVHGFGLAESNEVWFGNAPGVIQDITDRSDDGTWIKVIPPPTPGIGGNEIGWVPVVARLDDGNGIAPVLHSITGPYDHLFAYYRAGIPIMRPGLDGYACNPAHLVAVIWDEQGQPVTDDSLVSQIQFRTNRGSFSDNVLQVEFTPVQLYANEVYAFLYERGSGAQPYWPSVGLVGNDEFRSSTQINFYDVLCEIVAQTAQRVRQLVGISDIREMLKILVKPPIPKDRFANVARPLQAQITTVHIRPAKDARFRHEVRVAVKDANGKPVAGLPIAFLATAGSLRRRVPVRTNRQGLARMAVQLSHDGQANILAIVDELAQPLTTQIKKRMKQQLPVQQAD